MGDRCVGTAGGAGCRARSGPSDRLPEMLRCFLSSPRATSVLDRQVMLVSTQTQRCRIPHRREAGEVSVFAVSWCVCALRHVQLFGTLRTVAHQAPLSMGFFRHKFCSGLPCPPPGDLPDLGTEPMPLMSPALAGGFFTTRAPGKPTWETGLLFCPCCLLLNGLIS